MDIIAEILLRLPAKSLLRFRCVCKSWLALISDPSFIKNHISRVNHFNLLVGTHPLRVSVLKLDDGDVAISELNYPAIISDLPNICSPRIYGSCNGLVCVEYENGNFILWNPCTRDLKQLPEPELDDSEYDGESFISLAGFGYDHTIEDYKVIRATKIYDEKTTLQVLTLKRGSWRFNADFNHLSQGNEDIIPVTEKAFLLNEALHSVALLRGAEYEEGTLGIISFGLAEEKLKVTALFSCRQAPYCSVSASIVTAGSSLVVYHEFGIWMMKEYGVEESWKHVETFLHFGEW